MNSEKQTKRVIPKQLIFIMLGLGSLLIFFTNMGPASENFFLQADNLDFKKVQKTIRIQKLINETDQYLLKNKISLKAKRLHESHLVYLANKIANNEKIKNCNELLAFVPSVKSNSYLLFPSNNEKPSLVGCEIKNKKVIDQVVLAEPRKENSKKAICPLYQKPRCQKNESVVETLQANGCSSFSCQPLPFVAKPEPVRKKACPSVQKPRCNFLQEIRMSVHKNGCKLYTCEFKQRKTER